MADRDTLFKILDLARWAPSGDNTQPWRFEIVSDTHIAVHGTDTREWCLYDYNGHASHIAHGALLETLRIAATSHGLCAEWAQRPGTIAGAPIYDVRLTALPNTAPDQLSEFIERRTVQRRAMQWTPLSTEQRIALVAAAGPDFRIQLFETFAERWAIARLLWRNAQIRLTCPEAYAVHRKVIEWGARYSDDRIPDQAVGVDPITARLMRWVMGSWSRVEFFNRYLFGTVAPRIQLDFVPAMACAGHLLIRAEKPLREDRDYVRLGEAMQRVWLTATSLNLYLQPEMTPVIFRWYVREGCSFSTHTDINMRASALAGEFERVTGARAEDAFGFFCRVGVSSPPRARSLRLPLSNLWFQGPG